MHDLTRLFRLRIGVTAAILLLCALPVAPAAEKITHIHTDALGSPVAATDEQGNIVWRETYRPYGERATNDPAALANQRWHTGHQQDTETGLVYAGARYYDPALGRFMAVDPVRFSEKNLHSFNRYSYGNNNPYKYIDPDGQAAVLALIPPVIVGGIIYYAATPDQRAQMGSAVTQMGQNFQSNMQGLGDGIRSLTGLVFKDGDGVKDTGNAEPKPGSVGGPGAGKRFPESVKDAERDQSGNKCVFCGEETTREPGPNQSNIDHAQPKSRGGNNTPDNAQNTCRTCNLDKGAKTTEEYLR